VASDEQGQLQGANSALMGVTGLIGPGLFTAVFAWSVGDPHALHMPGIAVLLAAGFMAAALAMTLRIGDAKTEA
jgi:DHA1 family tetracycline resistance protein-like MFS transporter